MQSKTTIAVRTLKGQRYDVEFGVVQSTRDLKDLLDSKHSLGTIELFYKGQRLRDDKPLREINLGPNDYLAVIPRKGGDIASTGAQTQESEPPSTPVVDSSITNEEDESNRPGMHVPGSPGQLDTLLPGYVSRPNASPVVVRVPRRSLVVPATQEPEQDSVSAGLTAPMTQPWTQQQSSSLKMQYNDNAELNSACSDEGNAYISSLLACFSADGTPRNGKTAATIASAELPKEAMRLYQMGQVLARVVGFLYNSHIQPTWAKVQSAIGAMRLPDRFDFQDLQALTIICPESFSTHVHHRIRDEDNVPGWINTGREAVIEESLERSHRLDAEPVVPNPFQIRTDGSGTAIAADSGEWGDEGIIVNVVDPGARAVRGGLPPAFLERLLGSSTTATTIPGQEATQQHEREVGGNNVHGDAHSSGPDTELQKEKGPRRTNKMQRVTWSLWCSLVRAAAIALQRRPEPLTTNGSDRASTKKGITCLSLGDLVQAARSLHRHISRTKNNDNVQQRKRGARPPAVIKARQSCRDQTPMDTTGFLQHLKTLDWYQGQAVHEEHIEARSARFGGVFLETPVHNALQTRGIQHLYHHQAEAVASLRKGTHTVVATSTASGKSLCYNVPILEALLADPEATALFMFPTKALAQDQMRALRELCSLVFRSSNSMPHVDIYDGDTPQSDREEIRCRARLLITNPDMLHVSILPFHGQFQRILAGLRYVVVDEAHMYKGVFGAHAAMVLRRLQRLCSRVYKSAPTFALTTATIANPREHAARLLGSDHLHVVTEDGSPQGPKTFVLWNPPLVAPQDDNAFIPPTTNQVLNPILSSKRAQEETARHAKRHANQQRYAGAQLQEQFGMTEREWVKAVSIGRRQTRASKKKRGVEDQGSTALQGNNSNMVHSCEEVGAEQQQQDQDVDNAGGSSSSLRRPVPATAKQAKAIKDRSSTFPDTHHSLMNSSIAPQASTVKRRPLIYRTGGGLRASMAKVLGNQSNPLNDLAERAKRKRALERLRRNPANMMPSSSDLMGRRSQTVEQPASSTEDALLPSSEQWQRHSPAARHGVAGVGPDTRRRSPIMEISCLLAEAVQHDLQTIAFCNSRKLCELVIAYVREILSQTAPDLVELVGVYRAGYSPAERRALESALHDRRLRALAATNALELGLDVGALDVTLHLGFPGSVASLLQQAGRAGRREQPSLSVLVAWDGALDQYFVSKPERLFGRPVEKAVVDVCNAPVLEAHLLCAAAEMPLLVSEGADLNVFGEIAIIAGQDAIAPGIEAEQETALIYLQEEPQCTADIQTQLSSPATSAFKEACEALLKTHLLARHPSAASDDAALYYAGRASSPASVISLRAIDPDRFSIVDETRHVVLEEIEQSKAYYEVYDGAVYMHQGRTYICKKLDLDARVAIVRPADLKYYTMLSDFTMVQVVGGWPAYSQHDQVNSRTSQQQPAGSSSTEYHRHSALDGEEGSRACPEMSSAMCSRATVTNRFLGFTRIWRGSGIAFDRVSLFLPDVQYETEATYIRLPHTARLALRDAELEFRAALHAAAHAVLNVLPLFVLCNANDVGTECDSPYDTRSKPERILIFDKYPGGIGLAAAAAPSFGRILSRALQLVEGCSCTSPAGCPCCVQHTHCAEYNTVISKPGALIVLQELIAWELRRQGQYLTPN